MTVLNILRGDQLTKIVWASTSLFDEGLGLYEKRPDKSWSMTDCMSFVTMREHGLDEALTADRHFVQAGFRALLLEDS
jgi:predicted nucleic acid-binding protein